MNRIKALVPVAHKRRLQKLARLEGKSEAAVLRGLLKDYAARQK